ncbi:MAG: FAD-dependent thymidylate synthase [Ruminococcaceae bacterium]|nr:FAD-dependent thymidylate synthase [Oscillospiraceae bacterium]
MLKVTLLEYTPNPERLVAAAAKLCYSSSDIDGLMEGLNPEKTEKFIEHLMSLGHESPIEHVSFTFGIEGVSRALLAQITRHRIASFSVKSQRYVMENQFAYVTPPEIEQCPEAKEFFDEVMEEIQQKYDRLAEILQKNHYDRMIAEGVEEKTARRQSEKSAIEDARFVLPNGCETKMIVTMNARSLYNFFRLRCCTRAQWEIRELATQMLVLVRQAAPVLFSNAGPSCVSGPCKEGSMTCGKAAEMRAKFKNLGEQNNG